MEQNNLLKLRSVMLELLDEFVRICEENNLIYFLTSGTLLGAVRHKGFIPWDDDIDVAMSREDYEKFLDICQNIKSSNYYILSYRSEGDIRLEYLRFAKFCKKDTVYAEGNRIEDHYSGIFIDIWPYDKSYFYMIPLQKKLITSAWYLYRRLERNIKKSKKDIKYIFSKIMCSIVSLKFYESLHRNLYSIFNNTKAKYISFFSGNYECKRETHKSSTVFPVSIVQFEGKNYNAPGNWDIFLKEMYGNNYMELPPVEQRKDHNIQFIEINTNEKLY